MTIRRNSALNGRLAALGLVIMIAGAMAACSSVQAAQPAPIALGEATATQETAARPAVTSTDSAAANVSNDTSTGKASGAALPDEPRTSEGGSVTVEATPAGTAAGGLLFSLSLNTHMVDLSYDYRALATLRDDQGHIYPAAKWDGGSGGHHVKGTLLFSDNPLLSVPGVKWVELEIKGVAGVPSRTFRWDVR